MFGVAILSGGGDGETGVLHFMDKKIPICTKMRCMFTHILLETSLVELP